jgi:multidrug efflux pump
MLISDFCIRHPVFTIVINLVLVLIGLLGLQRLTVRELPAFDLPFVTVVTILPGAAAEQVERQVTTPIEQAVSAVEGIDFISSVSRPNVSEVQLNFRSAEDPNVAASEVRAKVAAIANQLPTGTQPPVVTQLSADAAPVIWLSFRDPGLSAQEITDTIGRIVKPYLSTVSGVGQVQILGERRYALRIGLDPVDLAAQDVTADEVSTAILNQSTDLPAGEIDRGGLRVGIVANTALTNPESFGDIIIKRDDQAMVRLRDVAQILVGAENSDTGVLIDGKDAVAVGVLRQSTANPLDVARQVRAALPAMRQALPASMVADVAFDSTQYIEAAVDEVFQTILIAVGLVVVVVLLFLGSLRSSLVTLVTIPLSLMGTVAFIYLMGYSINTLTLLAMVLAVGLVVDDAIVDVDNVQRHIDEGRDPVSAAFIGSREIGFAVIATTITLAAVYLPIGLVPGLMGAIFREFAFTLSVAVLLSGLISRTLSPMMCSRLLRPKKPGSFADRLDQGTDRLVRGYGAMLDQVLYRPKLVIAGAVLCVGLVIATVGGLPSEFALVEDEGYVMVEVTGPSSADYDYLRRNAQEIAKVFDTVPERSGSLISIGSPARNQAFAFLVLKPWAERTRTAEAIGQDLVPALNRISGVQTRLLNPNPLAGGDSPPIQIVVKTSGSYEQLSQAMDDLVREAGKVSGLVEPRVDLQLDAPQLSVEIFRPLAANLGVSPSAIANTLAIAFGNEELTRFASGGDLYKVFLEAEEMVRRNASSINSLYVRGIDGQMMQLAALVRTAETVSSDALPHFAQFRSAHLSGTVADGHGSGGVLEALTELAQRTLPPTMHVDYDGQSRMLKQNDASSGLVFLLALVFIYLVLSAQFESFRDPFIVLAVVPFAIAGAWYALALSGGSLNMYSFIGFVSLIGLIAKHGILITEFANQLRDQGEDRRRAVHIAAGVRLRPILMTTIATICGAVPLAIATGAGAVSRHQLGAVIIGGMLLGTLLSLFVVPAVYVILSRRVRRRPVTAPSLQHTEMRFDVQAERSL